MLKPPRVEGVAAVVEMSLVGRAKPRSWHKRVLQFDMPSLLLAQTGHLAWQGMAAAPPSEPTAPTYQHVSAWERPLDRSLHGSVRNSCSMDYLSRAPMHTSRISMQTSL
jgi:hypothetical protein